LNCRPQRY